MKKSDKKASREVLGIFTLFSIAIFACSLVFVSVISYFLAKNGVLTASRENLPDAHRVIVFMATSSMLISGVNLIIWGKIAAEPVSKIINGMNRLAKGEFSHRIKFESPVSKSHFMKNAEESFNKMAKELESTEMLRADFVNNFSHEFKTPIVSVAGFAKLLKNEELDEKTRREYIKIIEEESLRLSYMATNMLNLTRIENRTILNNTEKFNLTEQIRKCLLMFEEGWTEKSLDIQLDADDIYIYADEELMKEVWINLIDNAVKYSYENNPLCIEIKKENEYVTIKISNTGDTIEKEAMNRIFNKFYQADESHSSKGNGIGLSIVKKIVELHKGEVKCQSEKGHTTFIVKLPA